MENIVLSDFDTVKGKNKGFLDGLNSITNMDWKWKTHINNFSHRNPLRNFLRLLNYFAFSFNIFLHRKNYKNVLAWQQFYGLCLCWFMAFFHKSGLPNISIMTFIYIEKKGLVGKLYKHFINKALYCHSLKYIFVLSTNEISKYETIFPQIKGKIIFHKMGISNETVFPAKKGNYYLSAGRSNRDYDFLLKCFEENRLPLIILSDTFKPKDLPSNIKIIDNCFGTDFEKMVSECFCFLISLKDVPVSSGQLATLTALKYHKPVIACKNPGINDYISNDVNGFLINKDYSELMNCINKLQDNNVYSRLTTNKQVYTDFTLGQNIGDNLMDQN